MCGIALESEFSVYSPIIMLVVVAVIAMVLSRTVRRESRTIGALMALGYRRSELMRHYLWYALIPAEYRKSRNIKATPQIYCHAMLP